MRLDARAVTADRLEQTIAALRGAKIRVIDVFPALAALALKEDVYYRTDSHWNERGAAGAAQVVAAALREWGLAPRQRAEFQVSTAPARERPGDLYVLGELDRAPRAFRPPPDVEGATTIKQFAAPGVGLLDNVSPPELALIGTSFSIVGKFGEFLALALGSPIDFRAQAGQGLLGSAKAYVSSPEFATSPARVVVWEIPERFMQGPLNRQDLDWSRSLAATDRAG